MKNVFSRKLRLPFINAILKRKNRTFFRYASVLLDKAECLLNMSKKEENKAALKKFYEYIEKLSCDTPTIYTQNRMKLMGRLDSENKYVLPRTLD